MSLIDCSYYRKDKESYRFLLQEGQGVFYRLSVLQEGQGVL